MNLWGQIILNLKLMKMYWLFIFFLVACKSPDVKISNSNPVVQESASLKKINGISLVAAPHPIDSSEFNVLTKVDANYVCLLPFAFVRNGEPKVYYNTGHQWYGESPAGIAACIKMAHQNGLRVMIKPQIWMHNGFTGDLMFRNETDWKKFEQSYTSYIFQLLPLADSLHAEMFCLGNELDSFAMQRKTYWSHLIDTARSMFHGKLIYAENWDCYDRFPLWNKLDYIGTNAYFPLCTSKTPSVDELLKKWKDHFEKLKTYSAKFSKQILFTEYGYRSIDYATKEPWDSYCNSPSNNEAQKNAYEAFYQTFWNEEWCAGGFSWKWIDSNSETDVPIETDYTPQGKPAMDVLKKWYGGNSK